MWLSMMWAPHAAIRNVCILNIRTEFNFINLEHGWYETQLHPVGAKIQEVTVEIVLTECCFFLVVWTIRDEVTSFIANDIFGTTSIWSVAIESRILKNVKTNKSMQKQVFDGNGLKIFIYLCTLLCLESTKPAVFGNVEKLNGKLNVDYIPDNVITQTLCDSGLYHKIF